MWIDYWNVLRLVDENKILTWCVWYDGYMKGVEWGSKP
jgi:hypothetical protein